MFMMPIPLISKEIKAKIQQHDGERQGDIFRGAEDRGERLHVIFRRGGMAAMQQPRHLSFDRGYNFRVVHLCVHHPQDVNAGVILHQAKRYDHRLVFDFRQTKGGYALAEKHRSP